MKTQHQRQYFYLVCRTYDECTQPAKCFLQEHEAIVYGRRLATKEEDPNIGFELYRQEITRTGTFEFVRTLDSYERESSAKSQAIEPFNWDNVSQGSDNDIDTRRA